ncbi:MAG: flagellar basal body rod protein FlgB [Deltaproteobacteria bacterium]|nr:flagellar basal body rod protein FlgB [Deltaproteobacteria bacterium]
MAGLIDKIFDNTLPGLTKAMDLTWQRNQAITSNIANAETPQYRAVDVNFEKELETAFGNTTGDLIKTDARHLDTSGSQSAHFTQDTSGATKADGNNVDIDIQMGKLAYNSGQYSIATNLMRKKLGVLRRIISESR